MDSRTLDLAAEFCDLVGKAHLLEYLGLPEDASPEAAQKKLRARRKYMQGMQSNPKYKAEAIFLIKHFAALSSVLEEPIPYLKDAGRRAESQHIPVLEMTIRGVLAGGTLSQEQEDYLRRNARELGVTDATFDELLDRLAREANVPRAVSTVSVSAEELKSTDFYLALGAPRHATRDEIYACYRARTEECREIADARQREATRTRIEKAWKVLSDDAMRRTHDLSWTRTGPPARNREVARPRQVATAPPVKPREADPSVPPADTRAPSPARMELLSEVSQRLRLSGTPITVSIEVRNAGELPLRGSIRSDREWLQVVTTAFAPDARQQSIKVVIDPSRVPSRSDAGQVVLVSESGETATVEFDVYKPAPPFLAVFAGGGVLALIALLAVAYVLFGRADTRHVIDIDPWAEEILIDGKRVGAGHRLIVEASEGGLATLSVRHANFKPWVRDIALEGGTRTEVRLDLSAPMDFAPAEGMKRGNLATAELESQMAYFRPRLDGCLRSALTVDRGLQGAIRIHIGREGRAVGLDVQGDGTGSPAVLSCLKRQAAGLVFSALTDGEFATVRYDYVIPAP